jgi:hypothetical protein
MSKFAARTTNNSSMQKENFEPRSMSYIENRKNSREEFSSRQILKL